ncbi:MULTISPECIES: spore coat protein [Lysinibacillus]|uniref:spore coat protein n=1 Tax=Lysinibacillus TaxID=400634 RepID=UPI001FE76195|nr:MULTISPECIES: spore coat protein [Lysinibacillus]
MGNNHGHHHNETDITQDFDLASFMGQESDELIWIKDSIDVTVKSTDTQAAVSLQVGLQLAIALVVSVTVADSEHGRHIAHDLFQKFNMEQTNKQKIFVKNSKDVNITTTDTDLAVNIQALLQVLVSLVAKLDIL